MQFHTTHVLTPHTQPHGSIDRQKLSKGNDWAAYHFIPLQIALPELILHPLVILSPKALIDILFANFIKEEFQAGFLVYWSSIHFE